MCCVRERQREREGDRGTGERERGRERGGERGGERWRAAEGVRDGSTQKVIQRQASDTERKFFKHFRNVCS